MSGYMSGLVLLVGPLDRCQRNVLYAIADSADDKTGHCWPSIQTLANKTLFTTRYVIDAVAQLESNGWMKVEHRAVKGRYTAFTVDVDRLETLRFRQKELEKQRKRSGTNVSQDQYIADLRGLHESHMNTVHTRSDDPAQISGEQSSHDDQQISGEQSSREIDQSQVKSTTSQVNCVAVSGEIRSTPINVVKHQETSLEGGAAPFADEFPEGLPELTYAQGILERRTLSGGRKMLHLLGEAIGHIVTLERVARHRAAQLLDARIEAAQTAGDLVNAWWFEDQHWKPNPPQARGHRSPLRDVPKFTPTSDADADAEERNSYNIWRSMPERYQRENPWKGRVFA